jgi:hypothetical protein
MRAQSAVIYALVASLLISPAVAQTPQDAADMWRSFAQKLNAGALVSVRTHDGKYVEGHLIQVTNDAVRINQDEDSSPGSQIAFTDIDKIDRRRDR